jgi:hypothetical protein
LPEKPEEASPDVEQNVARCLTGLHLYIDNPCFTGKAGRQKDMIAMYLNIQLFVKCTAKALVR